jgi:hypothetical protein
MAAFLVVLSPPAAGSFPPIVDPCPIDLPWVAAAAQQASHHAGHHQADPSSDQPSEHRCHCIGTCAGTAPAAVPAAPGTIGEPSIDVRPASPGVDQNRPRIARPRFLTPPSHAPPIA